MISSPFYRPQGRVDGAGCAGHLPAGLAYYWFYSRHHLVADAPEEEFAVVTEAEKEVG
jgi:ethanolamine permease